MQKCRGSHRGPEWIETARGCMEPFAWVNLVPSPYSEIFPRYIVADVLVVALLFFRILVAACFITVRDVLMPQFRIRFGSWRSYLYVRWRL